MSKKSKNSMSVSSGRFQVVPEELYDIPEDHNKKVIITKQVFLDALSNYYKKPIKVKDLTKNDRDILDKIVENNDKIRIYNQTQKEEAERKAKEEAEQKARKAKKHNIKDEDFVQRKKSRKIANFTN